MQVDVGYTGVRDVTKTPIQRDDAMQSFWLAETLKYMYLLFSPKDKLDLDEWVRPPSSHRRQLRTCIFVADRHGIVSSG